VALGHTDLSLLLQNAIRWVAGEDAPVTIEGKGLIEAFAWEQSQASPFMC